MPVNTSIAIPPKDRRDGHIYDFHTVRTGNRVSVAGYYHFGGSMGDLVIVLIATEPDAYFIDLIRLLYKIDERTLPHWQGMCIVTETVLTGEPVYAHVESLLARGIIWQRNPKSLR
jgi:hypothetical protein